MALGSPMLAQRVIAGMAQGVEWSGAGAGGRGEREGWFGFGVSKVLGLCAFFHVSWRLQRYVIF